MLEHQAERPPPLPDDNDSDAALRRKVAFLSRPDSYKPQVDAVRARETHMSWVFMNGQRVYKLKKPVRFPYLDFSTLERREAMCRAEASLNRRLAPDVYLGVVPLTQDAGGYAIAGTGRVADWLVVMRKLDEDDTLEAALLGRRAGHADVDRLAGILGTFYAHAARILINPESYLVSLRKAAVTDWTTLLNGRFDLPRGRIARLAAIQRRFLDERSDLLASRVRGRLIVDAHGDLRPEHIWLSAPYPIIDCLEFDPRLRALDALDEVAFLHLECERLGERWIGDAIRRRLARLLDDDPASGVFLFYRIGRAMLRARLSIAHLIDPHPRTPEKWPRQAASYLGLAEADATRLERILESGPERSGRRQA
jgi:aminoglycoside phosphotransferase family enzyme